MIIVSKEGTENNVYGLFTKIMTLARRVFFAEVLLLVYNSYLCKCHGFSP